VACLARRLHGFLSPMMLQTHLPDVRDRARAAFLGLAVGDARPLRCFQPVVFKKS
jgi:hypothetical protein